MRNLMRTCVLVGALLVTAVVFAADHPRRREYWVGGSTAATLAANAIVPGLLDRYLARTGFQAQQTDQPPKDPGAPTNLWEPADRGEDYTAHGSFDRQAHARSLQLWASHHHGMVVTAATALSAFAALTHRRLGARSGK